MSKYNRFKKGDWIVTNSGFGPQTKRIVRQAPADDRFRSEVSYLRHATNDEIAQRQAEIGEEDMRWKKRVSYEATPAYQDAGTILCQDIDDLVSLVPSVVLAEVAKYLRNRGTS